MLPSATAKARAFIQTLDPEGEICAFMDDTYIIALLAAATAGLNADQGEMRAQLGVSEEEGLA